MKINNKLKTFGYTLIICLLASCNGGFSGVYDSPDKMKPKVGFIEASVGRKPGKIYVISAPFDQWVYLNFHKRTIEVVKITKDEATGKWEEGKVPQEWDLAIHRYDIKTNGGAGLETKYNNIEELLASGNIPQGNYVEDKERIITVDLSTMLQPEGPAQIKSTVNPELKKWLNLDMSEMPPIYTPSHKVYSVRFADGTYMAFKVISYKNEDGEKGYLRINYLYPVKKN